MRILLASVALLSLITSPLRASGGVSAAPSAHGPRSAGNVAAFSPVSMDWGKSLHLSGAPLKGLSPFFQGLALNKFTPANPDERAALAPLVAQLAQKGLTPAAFNRMKAEKKAEALNAAASAAQAQLKADAALLNGQVQGLLAQAQAGTAKTDELTEALAAYKRVGFYNQYLEQAENEAVAQAGQAVRRAIGRATETMLEKMLAEPQLSAAAPLDGVQADDRANLQLTPYTPIAGVLLLTERLAEPIKNSKELGIRQGDIVELANISLAETGREIQFSVASQLQQELQRKRVPKAHALVVNKILETVAKDSPYGDVKALAARGLLGSPALGDGVQRAANIAVDAGSKSFMQWVRQAAAPLAASEDTGKVDKPLIEASIAGIDQALAALASAQAPPAPAAEPAEAPGDGAPAEVTGSPNAAAAQPAAQPARSGILDLVKRHPVWAGFVALILALGLYGVFSGRFNPAPAPVQPPVVTQPAPGQPATNQPADYRYTDAEKQQIKKIQDNIIKGRAMDNERDD